MPLLAITRSDTGSAVEMPYGHKRTLTRCETGVPVSVNIHTIEDGKSVTFDTEGTTYCCYVFGGQGVICRDDVTQDIVSGDQIHVIPPGSFALRSRGGLVVHVTEISIPRPVAHRGW